jgi:hypothetical protein
MSLRVACDLDGTLADLEHALQREAQRIFGELVSVRAPRTPRPVTGPLRDDVKARDPRRRGVIPRALSAREQSRLWRHVSEIDNFWETLPEIESGAVSRLAMTAADQGWEVIFITSRPDTAGATVQVQSQRWLRRHGFELPTVCVVSASRGTVAAALSLDTVIDDSPENCVDVSADSHAMPLLVWRDAADRLPPGLRRLPIHIVPTMAEALEYLTRVPADASAPRRRLGSPR